MSLVVTGLPNGTVVEANAWRFDGTIVVRQLAEIFIAPVIRQGLSFGDSLSSFRQPDRCVGMDFYFAPAICKEHLDDEPRLFEFWSRIHPADHGRDWIHFAYPYVAWDHGVLVARSGPDVELWPEHGGFATSMGGFAYSKGPLPKGPRRARAPRIPEIAS